MMKAAVLSELCKPLSLLDNIEIPPLKRGQVLVQIAYSGVCHSQVMEARGMRGKDAYLPHLLGHEATGVVQAVGPEVKKVRPGDRVILGWIKGSGIEAGGCVYQGPDGLINSGGVTTFSTFTVASENRLTPLPEGVPMDVAVLFGCAVPTGAGIVLNQAAPKPGSTIAVFGVGGVGLSAVMATQLVEPAMVVAVDIAESKLALAKDFGATVCINSRNTDPVSKIRELTEGKGVDYAIDCAGLVKTIEQAFESTRRGGGRCLFASHPRTGDRISIDPFELNCGKSIEGSWGGASVPDRDVPRFADLYRKGKLPLEKLISRRYKLDEINEALDDLEAGRVTRPLLEISPSLASA